MMLASQIDDVASVAHTVVREPICQTIEDDLIDAPPLI